MITVKFLGGAKKSFSTDKLQVDASDISISELLEILLLQKPENTLELDPDNILIAVNGIDSSAIEGKSTIIKNNDLVSIIPIIHGGSSKRIIFSISNRTIQIIEINNEKLDVAFFDKIRKEFPKLKIQAISSNFVLNSSHAKKILSISLIAQKNKILLSNKLEIDILMRFALSSQISEAIASAGIKSTKNFLFFTIGNKKQLDLLYSKLLPFCVNPFSKNNTSFLTKKFKINKKELQAVLSESPLEDILVEKATVLF